MLKTDLKLCDKIKPNINVKHYTCSPFKTSRLVWFEDNTFMHVETPFGGGDMFKQIENYTKQNNLKLELIQNIKEKKHTINLFKLVE